MEMQNVVLPYYGKIKKPKVLIYILLFVLYSRIFNTLVVAPFLSFQVEVKKTKKVMDKIKSYNTKATNEGCASQTNS